MKPDEERNAYQIVLNRAMEHNGSGRTGYKFILDAKPEIEAQRNASTTAIQALQSALANEQAKPPKEVVKEIEKIVVEYQEKIVEVPVETNPKWLDSVINFIRGVLKIK